MKGNVLSNLQTDSNAGGGWIMDKKLLIAAVVVVLIVLGVFVTQCGGGSGHEHAPGTPPHVD
jgi:hypothetical protein